MDADGLFQQFAIRGPDAERVELRPRYAIPERIFYKSSPNRRFTVNGAVANSSVDIAILNRNSGRKLRENVSLTRYVFFAE